MLCQAPATEICGAEWSDGALSIDVFSISIFSRDENENENEIDEYEYIEYRKLQTTNDWNTVQSVISVFHIL